MPAKKKVIELRSEEQRIGELRDIAYLEKLEGAIDERRWLRADSKLAHRLELVRSEIERIASAREPSGDRVESTLELLERTPELYLRQHHSERARLLETVTSNCIVTAESIVPVYRKPFGAMAERLRSGIWLGVEDSNSLRGALEHVEKTLH